MTSELRGRVAVVTGAGRGIGRAIALRLAAEGCRVAALARTVSELNQTVAEGAAVASEPILPVPADLTSDATFEPALDAVTNHFGWIAILINNAGFAPPRRSLLKTSPADLDRTLVTCLRAPIMLSRLVLPDMLAHGDGAIINIASVAGRQGRAGEAAYAAAKFGLLGFSQALFHEVRNHGIKVTTVCPGWVDTALIPPNKRVDRAKFLQPSDIAEVVFHTLCRPARLSVSEIVVEPQYDPIAGS